MASPNPWPLSNKPRPAGGVAMPAPTQGPAPPVGSPGSLQYGGAQQGGMASGGFVTHNQRTGEIMHSLTVNDVERLAKAGVVIKFEDIASQVMPDPVRIPETYTDPRLSQAIADRLSIAATGGPNLDHNRPRFDLACSRHKDKVYVFASYWGGIMPMLQGEVRTEPCILIDDAAVFPSDALMAKLIFLKEQAK